MTLPITLSANALALPVYYVRVPVFCAVTGYSQKAVEGKIRQGVWIEGKHYRRAPDGHILMDLRAFHEWAENPNRAA